MVLVLVYWHISEKAVVIIENTVNIFFLVSMEAIAKKKVSSPFK